VVRRGLFAARMHAIFTPLSLLLPRLRRLAVLRM
jgi:hypothetical protein